MLFLLLRQLVSVFRRAILLPFARSSGHASIWHVLGLYLDRVGQRMWTDNTRSVSVALFYGVVSLSMNFLNKAVVSSYEFNFPFFIMVCQMSMTVLSLDLARLLGYISLPSYTLREGKSFVSASFCFALHATLSLSALHGMNIPMYAAIKRCTPLVNLVLSVVILKKTPPSGYIVTSVLIITVGILVASIGDFDFDAHAYLMGGFSVLAQGSYLTLVQKSSESKKSTLEMVHINGYNTLPFFLAMCFITGEPGMIARAKGTQYSYFYLTYVLLILWGGVLTYSQFLCAAVCSALTASLVGVGKSVLQTIVGFFAFGGVKFHPLNILGILLNTYGGCMYTYIKYYENQSKKKRSAANGQLPRHDGKRESLSENGLPQNGFVAGRKEQPRREDSGDTLRISMERTDSTEELTDGREEEKRREKSVIYQL